MTERTKMWWVSSKSQSSDVYAVYGNILCEACAELKLQTLQWPLGSKTESTLIMSSGIQAGAILSWQRQRLRLTLTVKSDNSMANRTQMLAPPFSADLLLDLLSLKIPQLS